MHGSLSLLVMVASFGASPLAASPWRDAPLSSEAAVRSSTVRELALDLATVRSTLAAAPAADASGGVVLALPRPDGGERRFAFTDSGVMPPALQVRFPQVRAYRGVALDDPRVRVRAELTTRGFHAMVLTGDRVEMLEPLSGDRYASYAREPRAAGFECAVGDGGGALDGTPIGAAHVPVPQPATSGPTLRTYRTAVAATREFTTFWSNPDPPNVAAGLSGVVQAVNRVGGVYENELAIRLVLIANNDLLIYTAEPDPYDNDDGATMLQQNQSTLDGVIGNANYDFGHVVSTGGGGIASLNSVCNSSFKARGVTGSGNPTGDPFWIDYVAHEMGHQLNANHTFNGTSGFCGGNRSGSNAYEPGSGSTIMSYAGICAAENLQPNSDPHFHARSLEVIHGYTQTGTGSTCGTTAATGNLAPLVDAGGTFTIPARTPFALSGSATDTAGDTLSYSWEQYDLGASTNAGTFGQDNGTRPIFRVFNPTALPTRVFPRLPNLLSGAPSLGETLPTTNRTLTFRLITRDDRAGGGGVAWDATTLTVVDTGAPFRVSAPSGALTWVAGTMPTVTWDVAGTAGGAIACTNVAIALSTDGGNTFPTVLAAATANDGSASVTVPAVSSSAARVRVGCVGNVFFDVSDVDFTITIDAGFIFADGYEAP
jgi:hypothetical protein